MFLTEADLLNRRLLMQGKLNAGDMVRDLLEEERVSERRQRMLEGERYYYAEHDIVGRDFRRDFVSETELDGATGEEREVIRSFRNPNRSNYRVVNAFHRVLVDQKVYYLLSREPMLRVRGSELEEERRRYERVLSELADERFNETVQELVINASNHGFGAIHVYYDETGRLCYDVVSATELIPVYDTGFERELTEVIRYYPITVVQDGVKRVRQCVEWWTKEDVTYFTEETPGGFVLDGEKGENPAPHWWEVVLADGVEVRRVSHSWGRVPFVILRNNRRMMTDLEYVKGLIDAYDLLASEGVNNFADLVDLYWVIAGYGGEAASAIARKLKINRAVSVSDASGRIEAKQMELPVAGRIEFLKCLRRDIFHFGMGIDTDADKYGSDHLGNMPSGVSLKFQYTQLDLKAMGLSVRLKRAMKELLWFLTADYNALNGTAYDAAWVNVSLNLNRIADDVETVQMIRDSAGLVSRKTLLGRHPFVEDVNEELQMVLEEKKGEKQEN